MPQLKRAELEDYFQDPCVTEKRPEIPEVREVPPGTAFIYTIILTSRLELLVRQAGSIERYSVPVDSASLAKEVHAFRETLEEGIGRSYLSHAQQLYDWLVRPAEAALARGRADSLVFIPDRPLYTIPPAALHDGNSFLAEKFAIAVIPAVSLVDAKNQPGSEKRVLAAGLSDSAQGFSPLYFVEKELGTISDLFPGRQLRNREFRKPQFRAEMGNSHFTNVHIASHGLLSEDVGESYILTWDDKLSMDDIEELMNIKSEQGEPVDLLTLSACVTGAGNDRAALGLAGIAVKAGVKSVLATLWPVNDQPGYELVAEFYRQLRQGISKTKALQAAQLKMLSDRKFRHPGNWSQFLLIGS
jgi:CHAT domain-containing protein